MAGEKRISAEEMLQEVNNAIIAVIAGGQSYQIGSRKLTRADLNMLYSMKNDLTAQVEREGETHLIEDTYVAVFDGR